MADPRTYIRVHDGMPDHPKVDGLSDAAFRLLVTTWCWCSRHLTNGHVPAATWRKRGTAKARRELAAAGLVEDVDGGVKMHDYLEHQRSAEEVQEIRDARGKGGSLGNHVRWHVRRGVTDPDCEHCTSRQPDPLPIPNGSQDRSHMGSQDRSQTDRKTSPETTTETETEGSLAGVGESSSVRTTAAHDDDDRDSKIDKQIIEQLAELTSRAVTAEHAAKTRRQLLGGRTVSDPAAYVAACIRAKPRDFLPGDGDPPSTPVRQALREVTPDADAGPPAQDVPDSFRAERERMRQGRHSA